MFSSKKNWKMFFAILFSIMTILSLIILSTSANHPGNSQLTQEVDHTWTGSRLNAYDITPLEQAYKIMEEYKIVTFTTIGWVEAPSMKGQLRCYIWDGDKFLVQKNEEFIVHNGETVGHAIKVWYTPLDIRFLFTGYSRDTSNDHSGFIHGGHVAEPDRRELVLTLTPRVFSDSQVLSFDLEVDDLNDDGVDDVVTCGTAGEWTAMRSQLRIWSYDLELQLVTSEEWDHGDGVWSECWGTAVGEINGEKILAVVGNFEKGGKDWGELSLWNYGSDLTLVDREEWESTGDTWVYGVFIDDNKIYTVGMSNDGTLDRAQLRVWDSTLNIETSEEWYMEGDAQARKVFVEDVDGDGVKEVVTGGWANDGTRDNAQLRVWTQDLTLKDSKEWYETDDTKILSVYVADVDGDGVNEILTCGNADGFHLGQVTIWSYPDVENPTISDLNPGDGGQVPNARPEISASLNDDHSGVNVTSVTITVDGTDVTSSTSVTATSISYTPTSDLSEGTITVALEISDNSGNTASETWTFTVTAPAPGGGIPGFPLEGILLGLMIATVTLFLLRKRTQPVEF